MTMPSEDGGREPTPPLTDDLLQAARYGDGEDVQAIVAEGGTHVVNSRDSQGRTALHMAAGNGHLDVVRMLIAAGADVNAKNLEDNSPLHYAALNAHIPVIQELVSSGANVAALNRHERTPIDEAIGRNNAAVVDAIHAAAVAQSLGDTIIAS